MRTANQISKADRQKGYRGECFRDGECIGNVYLIDGVGYVIRVDDGVIKEIVEVRKPTEFRKAGGYHVSASQYVQRWEIIG